MYIIANKVHFCPEGAKLRPVNTEFFSKQLTTPGCKILVGLIESDGAIISYEALYQLGWGEKHVEIKPNTLYQHLSTLRRAFDDCGIEGKWIVTHQRKGVSLNVPESIQSNIKKDCHSGRNLHNHSPPQSAPSRNETKKYSSLRLFIASMALTPAVLLTGLLDTIRVDS